MPARKFQILKAFSYVHIDDSSIDYTAKSEVDMTVTISTVLWIVYKHTINLWIEY
jgi:hypothetical protein